MKLAFKRSSKPFLFQVENEVGATVDIDASEEIGGTDKGLRPMELVAAGVAGCVAIDLLLILKKQRIDPDKFNIEIDANRVDGTPSPFENIHMRFDLDPEIDAERLAKNIQLVIDKYCSVSASLKESIAITFEITQNEKT
ncbi:MAG: OsmC family protein [Crocinitomicaceae bacterium]